MKRLFILTIAVFLMLGQWASLDHAYHEHPENEVCDYCLNIKSLEHLAVDSIPDFVPASFSHVQTEHVALSLTNSSERFFAARAPPRFI